MSDSSKIYIHILSTITSPLRFWTELTSSPSLSYSLLDTARVLPAEAIKEGDYNQIVKIFQSENPYLTNLLRYELVNTSPTPLNSDAFSPFNSADQQLVDDQEVWTVCINIYIFLYNIPVFLNHNQSLFQSIYISRLSPLQSGCIKRLSPNFQDI